MSSAGLFGPSSRYAEKKMLTRQSGCRELYGSQSGGGGGDTREGLRVTLPFGESREDGLSLGLLRCPEA